MKIVPKPGDDAHVEEERQQRRAEHDLGRRHRQEDQHVRGAAAAELVTDDRESEHRAEHRRSDRRDDADLERGDDGVLDPRDRVPVEPVVEREPFPDVVVTPARRVEREQDHDRDREHQVTEREERVGREDVATDPAHRQPVSLSVPTALGVDEQRGEDQRHQDERQRRGRRVVDQLEELRLDHVADHVLARRPEELGVDEVARRGNEREQRPGHDPGRRQRQRHAQECLRACSRRDPRPPRAGGASICSSETYSGSAMNGQEVVGDPCDHGDGRREQPAVRRRGRGCHGGCPTTGPSSERMLSQASVRTR